MFTGIAVIWYMLLVTDSYFQQEAFRNSNQGGDSFYGKRYVWGSGIYFGLLLIVGELLVVGLSCCSSFLSSDEDSDEEYFEPVRQTGVGLINTVNKVVNDYI